MKKYLIFVFVSLLIGLLSGCQENVPSKDDPTPEPTAMNPTPITSEFVAEVRVDHLDEIKTAKDWEEKCPYQVASFKKGGEASPEAIEKYGIFARNGHSTIESTFLAAYEESPESFSLACLSCHSSGYAFVYRDYGDEVLNIKWADVKNDYPRVDFWSCYQCHGNQPGKILTTNSMYSEKISHIIDQLPPGEAVCAQCHTVFTGLEALTSDLEGVYDVHKNGFDLDGIYDALVESYEKNPNKTNDALRDGVIFYEDTGVKTFGNGSYLDIEIFQGSPHQKMGLSCVDCHMPVEKAEDGTIYRSHNASGSVFESQAAMDMCMKCHTSDTIKTTEDLIAYTKGLQDSASKRYFEIRAVQNQLRDEMIQGIRRGVSEDILDVAREAYSRGDYYLAYSKKTENDYVEGQVPGTTSIHNYDLVLDYYDKAEKLFQDSIDMLAKEI